MNSDKKAKKRHFMGNNDIHYPCQTNHDACFIPESVRQYHDEPLYIIVAHWCMQQQDWVQRNQISEAFHIPVSRASYLMSYLRSKTSRVVFSCRKEVLTNKALRYEIYVTQVLEPPVSVKRKRAIRSHVSRRSVGNASTSQANKLWNQLCLERRTGSPLKKEEDDDNSL
ncbi:TPA: CaiF/GrlA family transcriptional regulator [Salmonella enterica]